ncbi:hypothetical protein [Chelatococcus sp. XZ-Ab1]|uniref:hypothetical protein n=1 Tax=Chelatococcus sp. XZ-Ab1 TaxID=3034027 RepID=UPI0023E44A75|nr:hypothetical protein [Chelatococcus sp. XZ-Ab1]
MGGVLSLVTGAVRQQVQKGAARIVRGIVLGLLAAISLGIGLVFAAIAAHRWLEPLYGPIAAPLIIAGAFVLAATILLLVMRAGRARPRAIAAGTAATTGLPRHEALEASALAAGRELARSLDGKQLILIALIAGFVSGRLLEPPGRSAQKK